VNEMEFQQEYGQTLSAAHQLLLRFKATNVVADVLQVMQRASWPSLLPAALYPADVRCVFAGLGAVLPCFPVHQQEANAVDAAGVAGGCPVLCCVVLRWAVLGCAVLCCVAWCSVVVRWSTRCRS
jgi:hypothetical protein